jgi:RecA/RadA recombinase
MFDTHRPMSTISPDVAAALATLQSRWGAAAPRRAGEAGDGIGDVVGALATMPLPAEIDPEPREAPLPAPADGVISTGFAALDGILGPGGVPRATSVAFRGQGSSGKTTLALRTVAEAQATGSIAAWIDIGRSFDPVEAVARGVRLEWLVVVTPETLDEGLAIAGTLLGGRSVDLLVLDLPPRLDPAARPTRVADRLHRLAALGRRAETLLVFLEPPTLAAGLATAVAESAGLRLELARRSWIRLGRDVVGQATEVVVARNRFGPPGRRAELRILYADGDERDACLVRDDLLVERAAAPAIPVPGTKNHATAPPLLAPSPARPRPLAPAAGSDGSPAGRPDLRLVPAGPDRPRRSAVDGRDGDRRRPDGAGARRPTRDAARERPPARA